MAQENTRTLSPAALERVVTALFGHAGWPAADCAELARHLVLANLMGHDSHGVGMVPTYVKAIGEGHLRPTNAPVDRVAAGPFLVIDARLALGQKVTADAVARAIAVATREGVCVLNLVNSHHLGRVGHYAEQAAAARMVSMFWVNVAHKEPPVAPFGGMVGAMGTNPHVVGVPRAGREPLILDFATSRIAVGKVRVALNKGQQVAPDTLLTPAGEPTLDPAVMFASPRGALLTFGEHKGSGIALMGDLLGATLGGGTSADMALGSTAISNNLFAVVLDPARLDPDAAARDARIDAYIAHIKATTPRDPARPVLVPGEPERLCRAERLANGIPVDAETWRQIVAAGAVIGVDVEALAG